LIVGNQSGGDIGNLRRRGEEAVRVHRGADGRDIRGGDRAHRAGNAGSAARAAASGEDTLRHQAEREEAVETRHGVELKHAEAVSEIIRSLADEPHREYRADTAARTAGTDSRAAVAGLEQVDRGIHVLALDDLADAAADAADARAGRVAAVAG